MISLKTIKFLLSGASALPTTGATGALGSGGDGRDGKSAKSNKDKDPKDKDGLAKEMEKLLEEKK